MKKIFIGTTMLAAVAAIGFAVSAYAWQPPTVTAPAGNVDAPLNTGPAMQVKSGPIGTLDNILGFFGNLAKLQRLNVGIGCPTYCVGQATDLFNAWFTNPNVKGGFALHNDGKIQILDGTSWTTTPGYVLTADDVNGTVKWASAPANNCPPGQYKLGSNCVPKGQDLPAGTDSHTLRYDGATQQWQDSGLILNNKYTVSIVRPPNVTSLFSPNNFAIDLGNGSGVGGRSVLAANVSSDNVTAGEYATFKTNAKGFALWDWNGNGKVDLAAKSGLFSQMVDAPLGQFTQNLTAARAAFGKCHQAFLPLLSCYQPAGTVFSATAGSTVSPSNFDLFATTTPKGIYVDNNGDFIIHDWTTQTPPAGLAGKVLTADASGKATWQTSSLPTGGTPGTVLTTTSNGVAWLPGLPAGTLNHTLRYDGTKWVDAGNLQNDASRVSVINNEFFSGKFTGNVLNEGLKVKSDGSISAGVFNAQNLLTAGFGSAPSQGVFQVGSFGMGTLGRGFQVLQPPAFNNVGIAASKGVPLGADVSGLQGTAGENALYLYGHSMGGAAPSVSVVTNSKNITLWNQVENKWANLTAGNGTFKGILKVQKQAANGWDPGISVDLSQASTAADSKGRDAIDITVNDANKNAGQPAYFTTNTQGFGFWTKLPERNNFADIRAGEATFGNALDQSATRVLGLLQIAGGSPGTNKVLTSIDDQGNAQWGTLNVDIQHADTERIVVSKTCNGIYPTDNSSGNNPDGSGWSCIGDDYHSVGGWSGIVDMRIWCPDGYYLSSGGGKCPSIPGGYQLTSEPMNDGGPDAGAWHLRCSTEHNTTASTIKAVCIKKNQFVTSVNVGITTNGPRTWHVAAAGEAPHPEPDWDLNTPDGTCPVAFKDYVDSNGMARTFGTSEVGYVHQRWVGVTGVQGWALMEGTAFPGQTNPWFDATGLSVTPDVTGSCALYRWVSSQVDPTIIGGVNGTAASSYTELDHNSRWVGKTTKSVNAGTVPAGQPNAGAPLTSTDVWFTVLKY